MTTPRNNTIKPNAAKPGTIQLALSLSGEAAPFEDRIMTIIEELDRIDDEYPNLLHMPTKTRDRYIRLSSQLIESVWSARLDDHGSIHSHLSAGEKDGQ